MVRIVRFNHEQHDHHEWFLQKGLPFTLSDVQILKNKFILKLELVLKKHTKVEQSVMKFEIKYVTTLGSDAISLAELAGKSEYEHVTVKASWHIL